MRRALVVAYYTPPLGLSGVMRVTKLCKYLPDHGWEPHILTVEPPAYFQYDTRLLADLERSVVHRTESLDPARLLNRMRPRKARLEPAMEQGKSRGPRFLNHLLFPDAKAGWRPFALKAGRAIIASEKPEVVFATSPPFTCLDIGLRLARRFGLPFVADFRDPWPTGFGTPPAISKARLGRFRDRVVESADAVLAVNAGTAGKVGAKATVLENGFDPADFEVEPERHEGFSVVHVGNLWQNDAALRDVVRVLPEVPDARLYLAGGMEAETRDWVAGQERVESLGGVDHGRACRLMKGADVLLYLGKPKQPVGIKLYEYLGARRPVLVYGPDTGEAGEIVAECRAGVRCVDREALPECLGTLRGETGTPDDSSLSRFDRSRQAGRLAELFGRLAG